MSAPGLSSRQTVVIAVGAVVAAVILGTLLFYSDIDAFLTQIGK